MSVSSTISPVRRSRSRFALRLVVIVLAVILLAFLAFDWWFYHAVRASLPQVDGKLQLGGLAAPVIVTRDNLGVPTIVATNTKDLFVAQGYVTAQERLWQMDMTRRFASGDLAAILGPEYVKVDTEQRILGLRQVAERVAANMDAVERAQFEAYAAGVNAYIAQHSKSLPVEFRFMVQFPHAWTIEDSILVGLSMTEFLNHYMYKTELERERILAKVGPELTADLYVNSSWRDHPPGTEGGSIENQSPQEGSPDEEEEQAPRGPKPAVMNGPLRKGTAEAAPLQSTPFGLGLSGEKLQLNPGSNNWVVSGARTVTGKPMLSNDMHLDLRMPNTWYEAHLTAGEYDVAGVSLPGMPYVIVGHNRNIAWGFTNLGPNVEDVYIEKFNDRGEYLTPQGWQQPEHRKEIIRVKGRPEVNLEITVTRHGPIITELVPGESRKLALKWVVYDPQASRIPFFEINSARNWQEFRTAFSKFGAPGQNVVYADVGGHIGYQATGLVPIRAGDGLVPVPGEDDAHEWAGYVPFDKLPSVYDPPSGVIATANGRITPDGYPYTLSVEWGSPYRTERIYKLLGTARKLTSADMLNIQTDVVSEFDRFLAQRLVYGIDHAGRPSQRSKAAADLMRNWDGTMSTDLVAPTLAVYSRDKLEELLLKPKLGDEWRGYRWFMSPVWIENVLLHQPQRWLPPGYANYDEVLNAAVEAVVTEKGAPKALSTWKWGRVHRVDVRHPFWSNFPILKRAAPGPQPLSGDGETVKQVGTHFGPSERFTADMSDLDHSTLNIVNGQSGNIFDEHFNDQWDAYYHGRTFALPFSPAAVERTGVHHLRLEP